MVGRLSGLLLASVLVAGTAFAQGKAAEAKKGGGKTTATWWGHAAWLVETPGGARILIDPWLTNPKAPKNARPPEKLDAILITHAHPDHVGEAQELAKKTGAPLYGCAELVDLLSTSDKDVGANIGGSFRIKDVTLHLVEAVHSSGLGDSKETKYGGAPVGYVLQIDHGPTLYHAGDTALFASMPLIAEQFKPTVAMLPIGGHYTMDPQAAAIAARLLKVRTVIPMHYGTFPQLKGTPKELGAALEKQGGAAKMVVATPGQPLPL